MNTVRITTVMATRSLSRLSCSFSGLVSVLVSALMNVPQFE